MGGARESKYGLLFTLVCVLKELDRDEPEEVDVAGSNWNGFVEDRGGVGRV
jgi:hypothetical protein